MNPASKNNSFLRLVAALASAMILGVVMGQCVDLISTPISALSAGLAMVVGIISTILLKEGSPKREVPSTAGMVALVIMLACYVVVGKQYFSEQPFFSLGTLGLLVSGLILLWLVFTSIAETSLLQAFGIGGFCAGFVGVIITVVFSDPFSILFSDLTLPYERTMVYSSIAFLCAIPGAFASIAGRMSGWGLVENKTEEFWGFTPDGRIFTRKDSH